MNKISRIFGLVSAIYGISWVLMYFLLEGFDTEYMLEYFRLGWTPGAGERPVFIQFFAIGLTIIICGFLGLIWFIRREKLKHGRAEK
jgi:hypothetical protein